MPHQSCKDKFKTFTLEIEKLKSGNYEEFNHEIGRICRKIKSQDEEVDELKVTLGNVVSKLKDLEGKFEEMKSLNTAASVKNNVSTQLEVIENVEKDFIANKSATDFENVDSTIRIEPNCSEYGNNATTQNNHVDFLQIQLKNKTNDFQQDSTIDQTETETNSNISQYKGKISNNYDMRPIVKALAGEVKFMQEKVLDVEKIVSSEKVKTKSKSKANLPAKSLDCNFCNKKFRVVAGVLKHQREIHQTVYYSKPYEINLQSGGNYYMKKNRINTYMYGYTNTL